jgi:hypothetical protein
VGDKDDQEAATKREISASAGQPRSVVGDLYLIGSNVILRTNATCVAYFICKFSWPGSHPVCNVSRCHCSITLI